MANFEVLVINLKRSLERRETMTENMRAASVPWRFHEAVDGALLSEDVLSNAVTCWSKFALGRKLLPNEIGCYFSHLHASKELLKSSMDFIIVLEDDCSISPEFAEACQLLSNVDHWDIVRLEKRHNKAFVKTLPVPEDSKFTLKRVDWSLYGAVGYAVSREGAQKIVAASQKISWPFDILFTRYWAHGFRYFALEKPVVFWNEEVRSVIDSDVAQRDKMQPENRSYYIGKRFRKIYDGIMRRLYKRLIRFGLKH